MIKKIYQRLMVAYVTWKYQVEVKQTSKNSWEITPKK